MKKINDFGEKIEGARKDLYGYSFRKEELYDMSAASLKQYAVKNLLWKSPNYPKLHAEGFSKEVLYFRKLLRDSLSTGPILSDYAPDEENRRRMEDYIETVTLIRDFSLTIQEEKDLEKAFSFLATHRGLPSKTARVLRLSETFIKHSVKSKQFLYTEEEKLLAAYSVLPIDQCKFTEDFKKRTVIEYTESGCSRSCATYFIYPQPEFSDQSVYEAGTYMIVTPNRRIAGINYATKEEAEHIILKAHAMEEKESKKKAGKKKKNKLVPPMLENIERIGGKKYRFGDVTGEDYIREFKFRGGQYGNWLTDRDRQASLNFAYDALQDLACVLKITPEDVSLNGRLAIAFGARGRGNALAHYEPVAKIISITKMRGAGSLSHEWIHAVDFLSGEALGLTGSFTNSPADKRPASFNQLMIEIKTRPLSAEEQEKNLEKDMEHQLNSVRRTLRKNTDTLDDVQKAELETIIERCIDEHRASIDYTLEKDDAMSDAYRDYVHWKDEHGCGRKEALLLEYDVRYYNMQRLVSAEKLREIAHPGTARTASNFLKDAEKLDTEYSKTDNGYWASDVELLARAGAAWIYDKCHEAGIRNDYLCGHANLAAPHGEERKRINAAFDAFFEDLKKLDLVHDAPDDVQLLSLPEMSFSEPAAGKPFFFQEEKDGQLCLCW
ncbi:MAG: hypothetical protein Q4B26_00945 [Eubacteriales bacterium]|nr:hypothetical protein [Eubacteriales bacterium]